MSTANTPKGTAQMATRNPIQTTDSIAFETTDAALAVRRYRTGTRVDEIADALETDAETVAEYLRDAGCLKPHDDPAALAHLFHDGDGHTFAEIAALFGNECCAETVRDRMDRFEIEREKTGAQRLDELDCEDAGLSPTAETWTPPQTDDDPQRTLDAFGGGSA